jgi:C4-dicarboxylate transporter DctQ subunit
MGMIGRFFRNLGVIVSIINKVFMSFASLMMAGLMVVVCIDMALRYFFSSPLIWGTEVTEILLLYITFLGAAWVLHEDAHVVIDVIINHVEEKKRKWLNVISYFLIGIVSVILIYYGFLTTYDHYTRGVFNPTILETPIALIIVIIPVGAIPLFLEVLLKGWSLLRPFGQG